MVGSLVKLRNLAMKLHPAGTHGLIIAYYHLCSINCNIQPVYLGNEVKGLGVSWRLPIKTDRVHSTIIMKFKCSLSTHEGRNLEVTAWIYYEQLTKNSTKNKQTVLLLYINVYSLGGYQWTPFLPIKLWKSHYAWLPFHWTSNDCTILA